MGVRRVPFKDWVWEVTGATPERWDALTGAITVQSNTIQGDDSAGGTPITAIAPCESNVQTGSIVQAGAMSFDVTMNMVSKLLMGTPVSRFIVWASAVAGTYLGNSYVLEMTPTALTLYRSDANVLTQLATVANAHSLNTEYDFVLSRDVDGVWTVTEDGVDSGISVEDTTHANGLYLGQYTKDAKTRWSQMRARYNYCASITGLSCTDLMTRACAEAKFQYIPTGETDKSDMWTVGEGVEITLYDGSNYFVDFWGKVESIEAGDEGPDTVVCNDWRIELIKAEGVFNGNKKVSDTAIDIIDSVNRVLTSAGVKATADAPASRAMNGETAFACLKKLAAEAGYQIYYSGSGNLSVTDATSASGLTITASDISKFKIVTELRLNVNTVKTYYSGGSNTTGGSGTDYNTYGRSDRILVDTNIPNATQATARANYAINNGAGGSTIIDVWCITDSLNVLRVGDTCTLTLDWLNPSVNATAMVIEKEYNTESARGMRFRLNVEAPPRNRYSDSLGSHISKIGELAQYGLGMQV